MLRYIFIFLPLFLITCFWVNTYDTLTDFIVPTFLIFIGTFGFLNFKRLSPQQKLIVLYVTISAICEIAAYYFGLIYRNNSEVYHYYVLAQLIIFGVIYSRVLGFRKYRSSFWIMVLGLFIVYLFNSYYFSSIYSFPSLNTALLTAFLIPLTLFQFRRMILFPIDKKLEEQPIFWFNFGTFLFYSFDFFFLGVYSSIDKVPEWMYVTHWGANIFLFSTYFIAIFLDAQPKKIEV